MEPYWKVQVRDADWDGGVEVRMVTRNRNAPQTHMVFTESERDSASNPSALFLARELVQELMDELWLCGVRPSPEVR